MVFPKMLISLLVIVFCVTANANDQECGIITGTGQRLKRGLEMQRGEVPWHALIYRKTTKPYMYTCGGTLISNKVVLSGAICFWTELEKQLPASQFAVAVRKLHRSWNDIILKDTSAQKSDVDKIHIPLRFQGSATNFQDDIAIVVVAVPFEYGTFVRPVCLNFDTDIEREQLQNGKKGKVAGLGSLMSKTLQVNELSYLDISTCFNEVPNSFREYVTSDKFCAKTEPPNSVCRGDSGNGLVFPDTQKGITRYYLRGLISTALYNVEGCNTEPSVVALTQISKHESFIKEFITK